jgi:hypothetical protein
MGFDGEVYEKEGREYERITKIINHFQPPELAEWRARVGNREANRVMKIAGNFGTKIDDAIRMDWKSPIVAKATPESDNALKAWESWVKDHSPAELVFPETLYSERLMIAGTPDFMVGNMIVDIKCSSSVKPVYFAQLGAYASLCGKPIEEVAVLRLDKSTGMYEFVKNEAVGLSVADCTNYFHSLLITYRTYKQVQSALKGKGEISDNDGE